MTFPVIYLCEGGGRREGCVAQQMTGESSRWPTSSSTRTGCHLCDEALALLKAHGQQPQLVDIDADAELREQFTSCVPVVEIDGKVRFRGRVNAVLLRRVLDVGPSSAEKD